MSSRSLNDNSRNANADPRSVSDNCRVTLQIVVLRSSLTNIIYDSNVLIVRSLASTEGLTKAKGSNTLAYFTEYQ